MPRILVVDDQPGVADSLEFILRDAGYDVAKSVSGEDALRVAPEFRPNVLLTDVLMPGINGFELALAIKKLFPDCRLLLFSGQATTLALASKFSAQFTSHGYHFELLAKPLHPTSLLARIQHSLMAVA
jgi:CheY-like chemotaxis protein